MWNGFNVKDYSGMVAETITMETGNGEEIRAYYSRPISETPVASLVLIPHMPGWDEYCREACRRFTEHGYAVLCPDIYTRYGDGTPSEVAKKARDAGMVGDESVMKDTQASINFLRESSNSNGKVGVIGMCSGGRHTFLAACTLNGVDAAADLWGGGVVMAKEDLSEARPKSPSDFTEQLSCPLIGIFGNDDRSPSKDEVNALEKLLKKYQKDYVFYRYDGAGHGIWYYDKPMYRIEAAMDSFNKVLEFFDTHLK